MKDKKMNRTEQNGRCIPCPCDTCSGVDHCTAKIAVQCKAWQQWEARLRYELHYDWCVRVMGWRGEEVCNGQ